MRIENYDFMDALKWLAGRIHYVLPQPSQSNAVKQNARVKEKIAEINKITARFFYDFLHEDTEDAKQARFYLEKRGISKAIQKRFGLGLSPAGWDGLTVYLKTKEYSPVEIAEAGLAKVNNSGGYYDRFRERLMFPILDLHNRVIGFGGRMLGQNEPKYLNSPETPLFDKSRHLYGLNLARKAKHNEIILVEGYMDVIGLHQAGFINTAGVLGTSLTAEHTRLLKRINCETVILLMDSDKAGESAVLRAIPILLSGGLKVKVLQVTDAKDPDEYIQQYGAESFARLLGQAQSHITFRVNLLRKKYDLSDTGQRVSFTQKAAVVLAALESAIETDAYAGEIAASTGISQAAILTEVGKQKGLQTADTLRPFRSRISRNDKGLNEARKSMLNLVLSNTDACRVLRESGLLKPVELIDSLSKNLLEIAFSHDSDAPIAPADIVTRFETVEEQQQVAEILNRKTIHGEMKKNLFSMAAVIKVAWLNEQLESKPSNDLKAINTLSASIRNIQKQYITMSNG
jgi:DNA primase